MNNPSKLFTQFPEPDRLPSHELRERLLSVLHRIETVGSRTNAYFICRRIIDLRKTIEGNHVVLAVVGQFKRGKTSLLNALLGSEVLPPEAVILGSVLTVVKYGVQPGAELTFQSGLRLSIPLTELPMYVSETANPANAKVVDHVEVSYPSEYLQDGVRLVISPGFDPGSFTKRSTHDFPLHIDGAIFVTSPDPLLSSGEVECLTRFATKTKLFVVMNKAEQCDSRSLTAILRFTTEAVSTCVGHRTSIYTVSARQISTPGSRGDGSEFGGLGFRELEQDLRRFMESEKTKFIHLTVLHGVLDLATDLSMYLQLRAGLGKISARDLESKFVDFNKNLEIAFEEQRQNEESLITTIEQLCSMLDCEIARFVDSKHPALVSALETYFGECAQMPRGELSSSLRRFTAWQIQRIFDQWRPDFESSLCKAAHGAFRRYQQSANQIVDRIRSAAFRLFRIELRLHMIAEAPIVIPSCYRMDNLMNTDLGDLAHLLPDPVFRWRMLRKILSAAPPEMNRHADLVAKDLKSRLSREATEFRRRVRQRLNVIVEAVRIALTASHEPSDEAYGSGRSIQLLRDIDELDQIANELSTRLGVEHAVEA